MVVTMASMVDKAISRSIEALRLQNIALAEDVRRSDAAINEMQLQGEKLALRLIATQGPVAKDLRRIVGSIAVFSNLERIGDYASGIARIVIQMADDELIKPLVDLPRMSQIAREMLNGAVTAFIDQDADVARRIPQRDDDVDDLYDSIFEEVIALMSKDPRMVTGATHLLWVAHNIERIGDRVTNICERVVFMVTGDIEDLDGGKFERQKFSRNGSSDSGMSGLE